MCVCECVRECVCVREREDGVVEIGSKGVCFWMEWKEKNGGRTMRITKKKKLSTLALHLEGMAKFDAHTPSSLSQHPHSRSPCHASLLLPFFIVFIGPLHPSMAQPWATGRRTHACQATLFLPLLTTRFNRDNKPERSWHPWSLATRPI